MLFRSRWGVLVPGPDIAPVGHVTGFPTYRHERVASFYIWRFLGESSYESSGLGRVVVVVCTPQVGALKGRKRGVVDLASELRSLSRQKVLRKGPKAGLE